METGNVMSLLDHLTELRKRMLWSIFALLVGMGVAWNYADTFLGVVERPLNGHTYLVDWAFIAPGLTRTEGGCSSPSSPWGP